MPNDRALVDANVLVYALYSESEQHAASRALLNGLVSPRVELCVTSQVFAEFFSVVTNPRRVSMARTPPQALAAIESILALPNVEVLASPSHVTSLWMDLVRRRPLAGRHIFDVQLVATMLANGVRSIYTFNRRDFEVFPELRVRTPGGPYESLSQ